jgi:hypothetical protein
MGVIMDIIARRRFLVGATTLVAASTLTGCFASFGATTALWKFNSKVTDSKWVNWLVFLGLSIIPVYGLFVLGDLLIFNTIEFYTGKNPIAAANYDLGDGRKLALTRDDKNPNLVRAEIRAERAGREVERRVYFFEKQETGFVVMDEHLRVLTRTTSERGLIELFDAGGSLLLSMDDEAADSIGDAVQAGDSPMALLGAHLRSTGHASAIASAATGSASF